MREAISTKKEDIIPYGSDSYARKPALCPQIFQIFWVVMEANFLEFMRVSVGVFTLRAEGEGPEGKTPRRWRSSRCSEKFKWHCRHWLENEDNKWVRVGGDTESEYNDVELEHVTIGEQPQP